MQRSEDRCDKRRFRSFNHSACKTVLMRYINSRLTNILNLRLGHHLLHVCIHQIINIKQLVVCFNFQRCFPNTVYTGLLIYSDASPCNEPSQSEAAQVYEICTARRLCSGLSSNADFATASRQTHTEGDVRTPSGTQTDRKPDAGGCWCTET